jgi:GTP-binding protein
VHITSAIFDRSAPDLESCPDESLPEFAFIGRSNVGKSSLLNMLAGKHGLAKVSSTPGHTKLINMFTINRSWRLVDLPGYGYAHVARKDKARFNEAVNNYLLKRENLYCVFALIDSSLPPQKIDLEFVHWLIANSIPFVLVFTKTDTVKPGRMRTHIQAFTDHVAEWCETLPEVYTCSTVDRSGGRDLFRVIERAMAGDDAPPAQTEAGEDGTPPPPAPRKPKAKRPNPARPW